MEKWAIVVIFALVVAIAIFVFLTIYFDIQNSHSHQRNILYPFSGNLPAPNAFGSNPDEGIELLNANKEPQIQCPVGYHVNIVGAWVEVNDPFSECTPKPADIFLSTCGISGHESKVKCAVDADCGEGMICGTQGICEPKPCTKQSDCGKIKDPSKGVSFTCSNGKCVQYPTCANINTHSSGNVVAGTNIYCAFNNTNTKCRPRDASVYLAKHCDGKTHCLAFGDKWKPNDPTNNPFGPLPCLIPVSSNSREYDSLPVVPGWTTGIPKDGSKQSPSSFNQGYYVHGVYTCIPD